MKKFIVILFIYFVSPIHGAENTIKLDSIPNKIYPCNPLYNRILSEKNKSEKEPFMLNEIILWMLGVSVILFFLCNPRLYSYEDEQINQNKQDDED